MTATAPRQPSLFIPHGGGPCFFMDWTPPQTWENLAAWLRGIPASLPAKPSALLVISGHWEEQDFTLSTAANPQLIYDYSGFPAHTYQLSWPAAGAPQLAGQAHSLLHAAGLNPALDATRGFDHGVFIPLKVAFPDADIPILTLSLRHSLDAAAHLAAGRALAPLRDQGVLIIGSGMTYHNMRGYRWQDNQPIAGADKFDDWLTETITTDPARLVSWADAPNARAAHPREEHLLPLMVTAGASNGANGRVVFHDRIMGAPIAAYRFD